MNNFREYSAAFHETNNDLKHYGVLGMRWGIRKAKLSDGSSARKLTRDLNRLDRQKARNTYAMKATQRKIDKYKWRDKPDKVDQWQYHMKKLESSKRYADRETNRILNSRNMKKYDLHKKGTTRVVMSPGMIALSLLSGGHYNVFSTYKGTKYKVKNKKKSRVM